MDSMVRDVFKDFNLNDVEINMISEGLEAIELKKKAFLITPGKDVQHIYYIRRGCLRTYYLDDSGKEHTLQFAVEGWWISDYIALFGRERLKAISYIECIQDASLLKISKNDFDNLCERIPKVSGFHIRNLERAFAAFHRRILENLTLPAKDRYVNFVKTYPNIEQLVKNYHIASFLGITTESLSRIRKELALQ